MRLPTKWFTLKVFIKLPLPFKEVAMTMLYLVDYLLNQVQLLLQVDQCPGSQGDKLHAR